MFYKKIDYTRMPRAWRSLSGKINPPKIIHVIGTNGKGSTGRFLAQILRLKGACVGHYTSPHIFEFRERYWLDGGEVSDEILNRAHERLYALLDEEFRVKTSYFEYATLLAAVVFEGCDYFVCEAGMGGERDATNVFDKRLSLFTPVGIDHTGVLGESLQDIAQTKFAAMSAGADALLNDDRDALCFHVASLEAAKKGVRLEFAAEILDALDAKKVAAYAVKFSLPKFLLSNFILACAAAKRLTGALEIQNLEALSLRGRCEQVASNVFADVGHNELGAQAIAAKFSGQKLTLIYNTFADKDYRSVLRALAPIVSRVEIFEYESVGRDTAGEEAAKFLKELGVPCAKFTGLTREEAARKTDEIFLAFGSFYLVEAFLRQFDASKSL